MESALSEYVSDAELSGANQYELPDGSKEKVDAVKRTRFKVLPPVLHLHLMRFTYDPVTDGKTKVNSRFEFPEVRALGRRRALCKAAYTVLHFFAGVELGRVHVLGGCPFLRPRPRHV